MMYMAHILWLMNTSSKKKLCFLKIFLTLILWQNLSSITSNGFSSCRLCCHRLRCGGMCLEHISSEMGCAWLRGMPSSSGCARVVQFWDQWNPVTAVAAKQAASNCSTYSSEVPVYESEDTVQQGLLSRRVNVFKLSKQLLVIR
uniref:Uncharacterized protein n=1 Tax=Sphaerodactylus townsendi TaxID=933632 RepID=A0ACB8FJ83_9SAUR